MLRHAPAYPPADALRAVVKEGVPRYGMPVTVHFILRVTDKGTPALLRCQRVIVTITS